MHNPFFYMNKKTLLFVLFYDFVSLNQTLISSTRSNEIYDKTDTAEQPSRAGLNQEVWKIKRKREKKKSKVLSDKH